MLDHILEIIKKYNMLEAGDEVVTALSGGADSVCLLLALDELKNKLNIKVSALHVNHCLRGSESDRDEEFCRTLCEKRNIPFICGKFNVNEEAKKLKLSTELAAREIRYRFFAEHSKGKKLATAHNANDNAETVIFNLIRGTGTKGISGIPPVRDNIIRPLIGITRLQIEKYLEEKNQNFVTDSTNLTDDYTRNKIRHNVIPVLEEINSSLFSTITSDSDNFRTDNSFIEAECQKVWNSCIKQDSELTGLKNFHPAVRRRCISKLLSENNIEVNSRRINDIDEICIYGGKKNLSGDIYIISDKNRLYLKTISDSDVKPEPVCFILNEGINLFRNKTIEIRYKNISEKTEGTIIDAEKISGTAMIRSRMPGDRIRLNGNNFSSPVKKLFNKKFDVSERDNICIISDDEGPVFIEKTGISERVSVTESTNKIMEIIIHCE